VRKILLLLGRIALTVLVAGWVYRRVDWPALRGVLQLAAPANLLAAVGLYGCATAAASTRWRLLLAHQGIAVGWWRTVRLTLTGIFFNLFLLGSIGGDAAKFLGTIRHAPDRKARLALSMVQDRVIGLGALLLLLTGFIAENRATLWSEPALRAIAIGVPVACAVFSLGVAVLWGLSRPNAADSLVLSWDPRKMTLGMMRGIFPMPVFLPALALSLVNQSVVIVGGYLVAHALGLGISFAAAGTVLGLTSLAVSLPITIAGLGVRDGMLLWLLGAFGFKSTAAAIGLSSCLLGLNLVWALAGAIAFYWRTPDDVEAG
jgi:uncharacterized membrane protein YbhN (UPF0104 family)